MLCQRMHLQYQGELGIRAVLQRPDPTTPRPNGEEEQDSSTTPCASDPETVQVHKRYEALAPEEELSDDHGSPPLVDSDSDNGVETRQGKEVEPKRKPMDAS